MIFLLQLSMEAVRAQQGGTAGQRYVSCADGQIADDHTQHVNNDQSANAPGYDGQVLGPVLKGTHLQHDSTVSLHHYVYHGDFQGFREQLTILSLHENFPRLLGALQASDDTVSLKQDPVMHAQQQLCLASLSTFLLAAGDRAQLLSICWLALVAQWSWHS